MDTFEEGLVQAVPKLRAFALRLYRNDADADDAVQTTLCRALSSRATYQDSNLVGWLGTIMMNVFRTHKKRGERIVYTDSPHYADHVPAADNPERSLIVKEMLGSITGMKPRMKDTITLLGLGLTYEQTAAEMNVPLGSVRAKGHYGRKKLRELTDGGL